MGREPHGPGPGPSTQWEALSKLSSNISRSGRRFDDTGVREELRRRINRIPGVELPVSKLELRPSFPIDCRVGDEASEAVRQVHDWFLAHIAEQSTPDPPELSSQETP